MIPAITRNFVNWADGMKLSKEHFLSEQLAIQDRLRDSAALSLNAFNFGILPSLPNTRSGLDAKISTDRFNKVSVTVSECRGLTPGGFRIEISESNNIKLKQSICNLTTEINLGNGNRSEYLIVISVNPLDKSPVGEIDPTENPPRNPNVTDTYNLNVLPLEEVVFNPNGLYHLTIGKIRIEGDTVIKDEDYIPPTVNILASSNLVELHQEAEARLSELEACIVELIRKNFKTQVNDERAQTAYLVSIAIRDFLSSHFFKFRNIIPNQAPVFFFDFFSSLARNIKNVMDSRQGFGKEGLFLYIKEKVAVGQAEFEGSLDDLINLKYEHFDIYKSVIPLQKFYRNVFDVFSKLANLEFVGKTEEYQGPLSVPVPKFNEPIGPTL